MTRASRKVRLKAPFRGLFAVCLLCIAPLLVAAPAGPGRHAVASAHPLATRAGQDILAAGGNAFDAAVTVAAVLGVVEPYGSGLGGGGFWLLHRARDGREVMVDGRETAPLAATADMYLDGAGEPVPGASVDGPLAAGIPGQPAALAHLARHYGRLPLSLTLAPAIRLAREGFTVDEHYLRMVRMRLDALGRSDAAAAVFLDELDVPALGFRVIQADLARTLEAIARDGEAGFYQGEVARRLVDGVRADGGIWELRDLAAYRVIERRPLVFSHRGFRITAPALPSSGGVLLAQVFSMLDGIALERLPEVGRVHHLVEVMRRAYEDRARYLGDSDFVRVPLGMLLDRHYARERAATIDPSRATPSLPDGQLVRGTGDNTTHYSIIDAEGNRVAATLSINYGFGSGYVPPGTGVLLNDEMDDFVIKPGVPNVYGLVGNAANAIAPGKRMLSSMTPLFVDSADRLAILGTPGGSRIISMVLLGALEAMRDSPVEEWVAMPRFHHQYLPDVIQFEVDAFDGEMRTALAAMGHRLEARDNSYGNMQAITWDKRSGKLVAASDPRGGGEATVQSPSP